MYIDEIKPLITGFHRGINFSKWALCEEMAHLQAKKMLITDIAKRLYCHTVFG